MFFVVVRNMDVYPIVSTNRVLNSKSTVTSVTLINFSWAGSSDWIKTTRYNLTKQNNSANNFLLTVNTQFFRKNNIVDKNNVLKLYGKLWR